MTSGISTIYFYPFTLQLEIIANVEKYINLTVLNAISFSYQQASTLIIILCSKL